MGAVEIIFGGVHLHQYILSTNTCTPLHPLAPMKGWYLKILFMINIEIEVEILIELKILFLNTSTAFNSHQPDISLILARDFGLLHHTGQTDKYRVCIKCIALYNLFP